MHTLNGYDKLWLVPMWWSMKHLARQLRDRVGTTTETNHRQFSKGGWVWRHYPPKANQKLGLTWDGPYLVLDVLTPWIYKIQKRPTTVPVNVHVDHLKPYEGSAQPRDWTVEESTTEPSSDDEANRTLVGDEPSADGDEQAGVAAAEPEQEPSQEPAPATVTVTEPEPTQKPAPGSKLFRGSDREPTVPFMPRSRRDRRFKPREIFSPS